jgi:hypothetical protein
MWLQSERTTNSDDSVLRQARLRSHQPGVPVGAVLDADFSGLSYDFFNLLIRDFRGAPTRASYNSRAGRSFEIVTAIADDRNINLQLPDDLRVVHPALPESTVWARISMGHADFGQRAMVRNLARSFSDTALV